MDSQAFIIKEDEWKERSVAEQTWMLYLTFNAHRKYTDKKFARFFWANAAITSLVLVVAGMVIHNYIVF